MGKLVDRVIRGLNEDLLMELKEDIRRQNQDRHGWKNRLSIGKAVNEMIQSWLDNGGTTLSSTPQALLRTMLQDVIKRAESNIKVLGTPAVEPEEIDAIVRRRLAKAGRILHPDTIHRYKDTLISGYLKVNRERVDGVVFKTFSPASPVGYQ